MSTSRLSRSRSNVVIAGVCAGIAKNLGWDASRVRLVYVLLSILSVGFPGVMLYVILWIVMPLE